MRRREEGESAGRHRGGAEGGGRAASRSGSQDKLAGERRRRRGGKRQGRRRRRSEEQFKEVTKGHRWVAITGVLDHAQLVANYRAALKNPALAHPHYSQVDLQRKTMLADGTWSSWEDGFVGREPENPRQPSRGGGRRAHSGTSGPRPGRPPAVLEFRAVGESSRRQPGAQGEKRGREEGGSAAGAA